MRTTVLASCLLSVILGAQTKLEKGYAKEKDSNSNSNSNSDSDSDPPMFGGRIKHVIALMFENRSFDHMIGYLCTNRSDIDGCLPSFGSNCSNPLNPKYPDQDIVYVDNQALYIQPGDPNHGIPGTTTQLFGAGPTDIWPPPMNGFVFDYSPIDTLPNDTGRNIMQCFDPSAVPIITTLANEFAVFDRWYADVPGPTQPNRLFSWMGTSRGMGRDADWREFLGFVGPNIYEMLDQAITFTNETWRVYFQQVPSPILVEYTRRHPYKFKQMETFFEDLSEGDLPIFTWLDPAYVDLIDFPATDQHPDHDVTNGEKFLKKVYEALRQSPIWEDTLLLIFYDEHGGFFDHVPPPLAVNPDGRVAHDVNPPFNFTRYGIRIPSILVSPYIKKGSVANRPDPGSLSQYSHSSLPHTMREQFAPNYPPFTDREEISLTFEQMLTLEYPRQDCPTQLPDVPDSQPNLLAMGFNQFVHGLQPVSDFQLNLAGSIAPLCGASPQVVLEHSKNQDTLGRFLMDCSDHFVRSGNI